MPCHRKGRPFPRQEKRDAHSSSQSIRCSSNTVKMPSWRARSSAMALKRKTVFLCLLVLSPACSGDVCRASGQITVTEGDPLLLTCEVSSSSNRMSAYWRPDDGTGDVHLGTCQSSDNSWSCSAKKSYKLDVDGQSLIKLTIGQDLLSKRGGTTTCVKYWRSNQRDSERVEERCRIVVIPRKSTTTESTTTQSTTTQSTATPVATTRTPSTTLWPFTTSAVTVAARNGADNDNDINDNAINDNDDSMPMALIIGVTVGMFLVIIVVIAVIVIVFKRRKGSKKCSARSTDRNASNRIIDSVESANDFRNNGDDFNPTHPLPSTSRGPNLPTNQNASSVPCGVDDLNLQSPPGTSHNLSTNEDVEMGLYSTVDGEDKASPPQSQSPQPQVGDVYAVVMKPKRGGNPQPNNNQALNQSPPCTSHNPSTYEDVEMGLYSTVDGENKASPPQAQSPEPQVENVYAVVMKPRPGRNPQPNNNSNNQALNQPLTPNLSPTPDPDEAKGGNCPAEETYAQVQKKKKKKTKNSQTSNLAAPQEPEGEGQIYAEVKKPKRGALKSRMEAGDVCEKPVSTDPDPSAVRASLESGADYENVSAPAQGRSSTADD